MLYPEQDVRTGRHIQQIHRIKLLTRPPPQSMSDGDDQRRQHHDIVDDNVRTESSRVSPAI